MMLFKKHVSASDLWVRSSERLSDFYTSSWQRGESAVPMLVVRGFLLAVTASVLAWSLFDNVDGGLTYFWLIYLTNWGLVLYTAFFFSSFIVSCVAVATKLPEYEVTPWYISMYWLFFNIATTVAILITILYWCLIFKAGAKPELHLFWLDVCTHAFNSLLVIIELVTSRTPARALHVFQPLGVGLFYAFFTAIYYAAGGVTSAGNPFIYPVVDWRSPGPTVAVLAVTVILLLVTYAVLCLLALIRDKISKKYIRTTGHDLPQMPNGITKIV